jgi:hypothetical protein
MSNVEPTAPALKITVAAVLRITGNQLNVLLRPNLRSKVADLHDVQVTTPSSGQVLTWNGSIWVNANNDPDGVQSVTGDGVGGTAEDVVLTFPTPAEIGAYPDTNPDGFVDASGASAAAPVQSVNGETGVVVLDAGDVGAIPTSEKGVANGVASLNASSLVVENPSDILAGLKTPFIKSPTISAYGQLFAWDSFQRANGAIGVSDSGHTWVNLAGDGATITNGIVTANTIGNITAIDVSGFSATQAQLHIEWGTPPLGSVTTLAPGNQVFLYIMKDATNGIRFSMTSLFLVIDKIVGGVVTLVSSLNTFSTTSNSRSRQQNLTRTFVSLYWGALGGSNNLDAAFRDMGGLDTALVSSLISLITPDNVFPTASDINYVGIAGASYIKIWKR